MINGRTLARVYPSQMAREYAMEDFARENAPLVQSLNNRQSTIDMRNGDRIYFVVMRSERDTMNVAGMQFNGVAVHPEVQEECRNYLRSRLRGAYEVDDDITEMEDA